MLFVLPVESIVQNKGGIILYDPKNNKIIKQYIHNKEWKRNGWRGGKIYNDYLIATDWTELHFFNLKDWKYEKSFTKNTFNDLHYVEVFDNMLYIVNTGIDAIEIYNNPLNPQFEKIIFLFDINSKLFKKRNIDLNIQYNEMLKFKPHSAHPNCISKYKDKILVTCFDKNQKVNTGEIIELNTGKRFMKKCQDCHDGIFYKNDFYTTLTRHSQILVFKDVKFDNPMNVTERIRIGAGRGWWRGMLIVDDIIYIFASDGYKNKKTTIRMAKINIKTGNKTNIKLPVVDNIYWDTIYQPNLYNI